MSYFAVLVNTFNLSLKLKVISLSFLSKRLAWKFHKFACGNSPVQIKGLMLLSHANKFLGKIFFDQLHVNVSSRFDDAHLRSNLKVLRLFVLVHKKETPGELEVHPDL